MIYQSGGAKVVKEDKTPKRKAFISIDPKLLEAAEKRCEELRFSGRSEYISHLIRMDTYPLRKEQ
jgi:metal-responsive CopG/Arc/MetJ family transcriptional regulator